MAWWQYDTIGRHHAGSGGSEAMKKAEEYRAHAEECRRLANQTRDQNEKQQILKVAEVWEDLARTREKITKRAGSN